MCDDTGLAGVSRETVDRLHLFGDRLTKWTRRINLVSPSSVPELWDRHILDSLQLRHHLPDGDWIWADLGSGGGFPGLVVAILIADRPGKCRVVCVESDLRKATFLRSVIRDLDLPAEVRAERAEALPSLVAERLSARAFAPLSRLLPLADRHLAPSGVALLHKGRAWRAEVDEVAPTWRFALEVHASRTQAEAVILEIGELRRA